MTEAGKKRIEIYDTTLRDGAQGEGVSFSLVDKVMICKKLDSLGVDFVEGGYPLSNPKDAAFFAECEKMSFAHARLCAFGMTRRRGMKAAEDAGMAALVDSKAPVITIVGKTWDLHVDEVLRISRDENLDMIGESVAHCRDAGRKVFFDAEHFFDGYRDNPDYAIQAIEAALHSGAARLILCDTNGGSMPSWIVQVVGEVRDRLGDFDGYGIHTHNDCGLAVANALAAVEAGCIQVQGTINGFGERCGNADLLAVAANLRLKMDYDCLHGASLARLTECSRFVYQLANLNFVTGQPFVGQAAFAHKGGMHVHAVQRATRAYEHVEPEKIGNTRRILISELSGASNVSATLGEKYNIAGDRDIQRRVLERVQDLEHQGYQFEAAGASFELLLLEVLGKLPRFWELHHYRCVILKRGGEALGAFPYDEILSRLKQELDALIAERAQMRS